jgi:hypothetical protein
LLQARERHHPQEKETKSTVEGDEGKQETRKRDVGRGQESRRPRTHIKFRHLKRISDLLNTELHFGTESPLQLRALVKPCKNMGGPFVGAYEYALDPPRPNFQAPYISSSTVEAIHHRPQSGAYLFCPSAECHLSSDSSQSVG